MDAATLRSLAKTSGLDVFVSRFPLGFLEGVIDAHDADDDATGDESASGEAANFAFNTSQVSRNALRSMLASVQNSADDTQFLPLIKRPGSPFPNRISVGRATNGDVVLRLESVSKLHAHFFLDPSGALNVSDYHSANGTTVNGARVLEGHSVPVRNGDKIRFGSCELRLVAASDVFTRLIGRR